MFGCLQGGYRGFYDPAYRPIELTPELVQNIHHEGGTVLGSSRGGFDLEKTLDFLKEKNISQLWVYHGAVSVAVYDYLTRIVNLLQLRHWWRWNA